MDTPSTQPAKADPEWLRLWFSTAHIDIQWAKAQGWQALQWTVVLLAAIVTAAKTFSALPLCIYLACAVLVTAVSIFWLFDLHNFAKKARSAAQDISDTVPGHEAFLTPRRFDPDHKLYLATRLLIVLAAAIVVIGELLKTFGAA